MIIEGDAVQGVRRGRIERQTGRTVHRQVVCRRDGAGTVSGDNGITRTTGTVHRQATRRNDDRASARREDVNRAGINDGAARVGIRGGEVEDPRAGLDETDRVAGPVIGDDGIEIETNGGDKSAGGARSERITAQRSGEADGIDRRHKGAHREIRIGDQSALEEVRDAGERQDVAPNGGRGRRIPGEVCGRLESVINDEFAHPGGLGAAGGQDTAGGQCADVGDAIDAITAQQAAELEIEDVARAGEGEVITRAAGETNKGGSRSAGWKRRGGLHGVEGEQLGNFPRTKIEIVMGKTALPHHADTQRRVIGGVIRRIGDGPGAEDAAVQHRRGHRETNPGGVTDLTQIGPCKVNGRAGPARETSKREVNGAD